MPYDYERRCNMLTHLRIQNFKAWLDTGAERVKPIETVFVGNLCSYRHALIQTRGDV